MSVPASAAARDGKKRAFVIGAGLSGLAAATRLAEKGATVTLFEAAGQAGGRCRSYFDAAFGGVIDNGNHLVLSGNRAVMQYLARIGAQARLAGPARARFDFLDLKSGARWTLRPNRGPLPWWVLLEGRRAPGTRPADYLAYARLLGAAPGKAIGDLLPCAGPLWDRLMQPFFLAALNTAPEKSSAALAGALLRETLVKGGGACRPCVADPTLAAAFVEPALSFLEKRGAVVRFGQRLRAIAFEGRAAAALEFAEGTLPLDAADAVVLAVPPWVAGDLVPGLVTPVRFSSIVNAHFNLAPPAGAPPLLGVIGGSAEWIFAFQDRLSVTVSGADSLVERDREDIARTLWADVAAALGLSAALPRWQIVKEKRATFAATPEEDARRPPATTRWGNFLLAGDWTQTGLPATIEGAIRSGEQAASLALRHLAL